MRFLTSILFLAIIVTAAPAQALEHYQFSVGAGFNVNNSTQESEVPVEFDKVSSFDPSIAVKEQIKITDYFLFRTGLWFQEKSVKYDYNDIFDNGNFEASTLYASVPLTVEYLFNKVFSLYGGYIADFRINDYCEANGAIDSCTIVKDSQSVVHLATFGASFNAGGLVNFDINWQEALTAMYKDDGVKTNTFAFNIFFKL